MGRPSHIAQDGYNTFTLDNGVEDRAYQFDWLYGKSLGSSMIQCDIDTPVNWWGLKRIDHIDPPPVDENGVKYRLCAGYENGSHYAPLRAFGKHTGRKDGIDTECKQCKHERYLRQKVTNLARMLDK